MFALLMGLSGVLLVGIDQITKWLAKAHLEDNDPFVLIDGVFELSYTSNTGAAFSILKNQRVLLLVITSIALLALFVALLMGKLGRSRLVTLSGMLILSGGVGNMIDRIFRKEVIDFFYFKAINFAIFNMADSYVVVGSSLMLIYFLFIYKEENPLHIKQEIKEDTADGNTDADTLSREGGGEA